MAARRVGRDRAGVDPRARAGPRRGPARVPPAASSRAARLRWIDVRQLGVSLARAVDRGQCGGPGHGVRVARRAGLPVARQLVGARVVRAIRHRPRHHVGEHRVVDRQPAADPASRRRQHRRVDLRSSRGADAVDGGCVRGGDVLLPAAEPVRRVLPDDVRDHELRVVPTRRPAVARPHPLPRRAGRRSRCRGRRRSPIPFSGGRARSRRVAPPRG